MTLVVLSVAAPDLILVDEVFKSMSFSLMVAFDGSFK
jgi:hypothetical protein